MRSVGATAFGSILVCCLALLSGSAAAPQEFTSEDLATLVYDRPSYFTNRHAWNPCSLSGVSGGERLQNKCSLKSALGVGEEGWMKVRFGERNCTVTLKNCVSNLCYYSRDITGLLPRDNIPHPTPSSIFSEVELVSGAKNITFNRYGFSITPTSKEVTFRYSTYTCAEFYAYRGRVEAQTCEEPVEAVSVLDYGMIPDAGLCK